jgi:predicted nuclease of predicted toxin-antitoxin system
MKLLFDENISYRIVKKISDLYPESEQATLLKLLGKKDRQIWNFAKNNGFSIVTHDQDFQELSMMLGFPPKVLYLHTGNLNTQDLADLLRRKHLQITDFLNDEESGCLEISSD